MAENGSNGAPRPPINLVVDIPTTDQKRYQFSTFVDRDADVSELNRVIDKITAAGERIRAVTEKKLLLDGLEKEKADLERGVRLRAQKDELDHMEWEKRGKRGEFERRGVEAENWLKLTMGIEQTKKNIEKCKQMIAECDQKIGA